MKKLILFILLAFPFLAHSQSAAISGPMNTPVIIDNLTHVMTDSSTAGNNVHIMADSFDMPQLGRSRRIWIYLPPDYETSGQDYPVIYMHDGQNLFDDSTSVNGEWHVDETLDTLYSEGFRVPVVIGIERDNTYMFQEYSPWVHQDQAGDGEYYMQFIVETLKPYIDQNYRTLPGRDYTGIMGSSFGGFITHYGALAYQDIFSKAGIYSPVYWYSDSVYSFTRKTGRQDAMRIYMRCGGSESQGTINDMINMKDTLLQAGFSQDEINQTIIPGGHANETLWGSDFGEAYKWLFAAYANSITESQHVNLISLFPNPTGDKLNIPPDFQDKCESLEVINMIGNKVLHFAPFFGDVVDVSGLAKGIYIVRLTANGKFYQGKIVRE